MNYKQGLCMTYGSQSLNFEHFVELISNRLLTVHYSSSFCTSNLSAFDSSADLQNFGPNITLIFVPGALNCSNPVEHQYNLYLIILEGDCSTSVLIDAVDQIYIGDIARTRRGKSIQSNSGIFIQENLYTMCQTHPPFQYNYFDAALK